MKTVRSAMLAALAIVGFAFGAPAHAQWTYTDTQGSFYSLAIGADTDGSAATETRLLTLTIDTTGNSNQSRYLDAAAIKVSSSFLSASLVPPTTDGYSFVEGGTNSDGCKDSGGGFMCATGHALLSAVGTFTFNWKVVTASGALFAGDANDPFSLKAVYNAGLNGNQGFYQVSVPLVGPIPEPSTYALMLAGLGLVGFMARRRRSAA